MNKAYQRIEWENYPSDKTPINEQNLNKMDVALNEIDDRVITIETTKATKVEVAPLIKEIEFNENNGIFTITRKDGSKFMIDTKLEKIAINFGYDQTTQKISLTLIDGTVQYIDLSSLITQYEFLDTDTVSFFIDTTGKVSAIIKEGSIEEKHLRPDYLAEIKVEAAKAQNSANNAATSETNAKASENAAKASEAAAKVSETNAATSATNAGNSATTASSKATESANSAASAYTSATTATNKANAAAMSETNAANSATTATNKANAASTSETNAASSATSADNYAKQAQSYAVGTGNVRPNEATDNSKYYYEQAKAISESFAGALRPMGTVTFANLPALANATEGDMYNISDQFTTTADFKEGSGLVIPTGSNVYKTADNKWDVLAGSPVTGVKGNSETSYRKGNVNLTSDNIGALSLSGGEMEGNIVIQQNKYIIQKQSATSNSTSLVKWYKGGVAPEEVYAPSISQYNKGGDGSGSITLLPYATNTKPYSGEVGLCIQKGLVKIDGKKILNSENLGYTASGKNYPVQLDNDKMYVNVPWTDTNTTYSDMSGASASAAGTHGLVPAPAKGAQNSYLTGGATFQNVDDHTATFTSADVADGSATEWTTVAKLASGETHKSIFGKISTMFKNVRYLYKMLGTTDISSIGGGTVTGAINTLNGNLSDDYLHVERMFTDNTNNVWRQLIIAESAIVEHTGSNISVNNNSIILSKKGTYIVSINIGVFTSNVPNEVGLRFSYNNGVIANVSYDVTITGKSMLLTCPVWTNGTGAITIELWHSKAINIESPLRIRVARIPTA